MAKKHLTSRHFFSVFPFSLLRLRLIYYLTRSSHLSQTRRRGRGKNLNLLTHFARLRLNERGVLPAGKYWCVYFRRRRFGARASHNIALCFCNCLNFPFFFFLSLFARAFRVSGIVSRVSSQLLLTRANSALSVFLHEQRRRTFCPARFRFRARESSNSL